LNILFIHEIDWLRKVVFEIHTLSELLSLRGHNVYAIDYESMWEKNNAFDFGNFKTKKIKVARAYQGAFVELIRPGFIKIPVASRMSAFYTHYLAINRVIKEKQIDTIILYSMPTNGLQTVNLAKKFGVPVIFRSIDNLSQLVSNKVLSTTTFCIEKLVYSKTDLILTISPKLSEYVIKLGASESKVKLLPLGVDTNLFKPNINTTELRRMWNLKGEVVVFVGTLPEFSGLDTFIPKFKYILNDFPDAKLMIVGDGEQRSLLEGIILTAGLEDKVIITGFVSHDVVPYFINLADVCINTFPVSGATKDAYPTKVMQYMSCGKPVVSTPLLGLKAMIKGEEQGVVYTSNGLEGEIISLLKSDERKEKIGKAALNYATKTHSYDSIVKQLETILYEYCPNKS